MSFLYGGKVAAGAPNITHIYFSQEEVKDKLAIPAILFYLER